MRGPFRWLLIVISLSLMLAAAGSHVRPVEGLPRSVDPELLATLDCNQSEPETWTRTLANGREVRVVSQQVHEEYEQFGPVLQVEYLTEFNPRLQSCAERHEGWDLLNDLRGEAEDAGAREISVRVWNERIGHGTDFELSRGKDGKWTSPQRLDETLDCRNFDPSERPPEDLLVAVMNEDVRGARDLIAAGADVEMSDELARCKDVDCDAGGVEALFCGMKPLDYAAFIGDPDMVDLLLRAGADPNAAPPCGCTSLAASTAMVDHPDIAGMLLRRGADPDGRGLKGRTPLMMAASNGNGRGVRTLLASGADVNARDRSGRTPLIFALERSKTIREPTAKTADCYQRIIRALLSAGADPDARDDDGKSIRDLALEKKDAAVLEILSEVTNR